MSIISTHSSTYLPQVNFHCNYGVSDQRPTPDSFLVRIHAYMHKQTLTDPKTATTGVYIGAARTWSMQELDLVVWLPLSRSRWYFPRWTTRMKVWDFVVLLISFRYVPHTWPREKFSPNSAMSEPKSGISRRRFYIVKKSKSQHWLPHTLRKQEKVLEQYIHRPKNTLLTTSDPPRIRTQKISYLLLLLVTRRCLDHGRQRTRLDMITNTDGNQVIFYCWITSWIYPLIPFRNRHQKPSSNPLLYPT